MLFLKIFGNKPNFSAKRESSAGTAAGTGQPVQPMTEEEKAALRAKFQQGAGAAQPGAARYQNRAVTNAGTKAATQDGQVNGAWVNQEPTGADQQGQRTSQRVNQQPGRYNYNYNYSYNYDSTEAKAKPEKKGKKRDGRLLRILGGVLAGVFGFAAVTQFFELWSANAGLGQMVRSLNPLMAFCAIGIGLMVYGFSKKSRRKRWNRYKTLLGDQRILDLHAAANATGVKYDKVLSDLQDMTDAGEFEPGAFVDVSRGLLLLDGAGYTPPQAAPQPKKPEPEKNMDVAKEAAKAAKASDNEVLSQIRAANDAIANEEISRKIDEIGMLTSKIFQLVDENPEREDEIRSFTAYYLPQTLKILNAYARMEKQGVEGQNIAEAKVRIETMLDKLVAGYAAQLDRMFGTEVLDITSDITVMEQMLAKDGLLEDELQKAQNNPPLRTLEMDFDK